MVEEGNFLALPLSKLGLKVTTDYRKNDDNWWVSLNTHEGGSVITLSRATGFENVKPGTLTLYFETSDIAVAHKELSDKGVKVNEVQDNLFGLGSNVKWLNLEDPEGNGVFLAQAHKSRAPFLRTLKGQKASLKKLASGNVFWIILFSR